MHVSVHVRGHVGLWLCRRCYVHAQCMRADSSGCLCMHMGGGTHRFGVCAWSALHTYLGALMQTALCVRLGLCKQTGLCVFCHMRVQIWLREQKQGQQTQVEVPFACVQTGLCASVCVGMPA